MLNAFICGGFHHEEKDELCSNSSPKKSSSSSKRSKLDKNPYSARGRDKFSELLADLDQKRQQVYSQMNPHDISFVRFAYSNTDDFVPIVVKVNNNNNKKHKSEELKVKRHYDQPMEKSATANEAVAVVAEEGKQHKLVQTMKNKNYYKMMKHPSFYVPAVLILILVFLTVFGRSVTTLCTCVMWYVVPTLSHVSSSSKQQRKITARGLSQKKMVVAVTEGLANSPTSGGGGDSGAASNHSHQKSW